MENEKFNLCIIKKNKRLSLKTPVSKSKDKRSKSSIVIKKIRALGFPLSESQNNPQLVKSIAQARTARNCVEFPLIFL